MSSLRGKLPKKFIVLEMTKKWNTQIFIIDSVDLDNPQIKIKMDSGTYAKYNEMYDNTYYDPYFQKYLFRDTPLNSKIDITERLRLKGIAQKQSIKKLKLFGQNYFTVTNYHKVKKGFFMIVTQPVFSSDKKYAFISFDIYLKEEKRDNMNQYYFGDVTLVYEKQTDHTWKKIICKPNVIL